jgi:hypothetical protein
VLPQIIAQTIEILKPAMSFVRWAITIRTILIKIHETLRWYQQKKVRSGKSGVIAEIYKGLGEIEGITRKYRYRQTKVDTALLRKDMNRISRINSELGEKIKNMTAKSLFDIIKDPPQEFPALPSDAILKEFSVLELVIKEEMKNIGNVTQRALRLIKKANPEIA